MFKPIDYFKQLTAENRLCQEQGFHAITASGIEAVHDIVQQHALHPNLIVIDDTSSQNTYHEGNSFFERNVYTISIVAACDPYNAEQRQEKKELCREIFRQFHSRLIHDSTEDGTMISELEFLDLRTVYSREYSVYALPDRVGLYFLITNDEAIDLTYNQALWT